MKILLPVAVFLALAASVVGENYELDPNKLAQRYNLIQSLVAAGVPRKGGNVHPGPIGTRAKSFGAVLGSQYKAPTYSQKLPYRHSTAGYAPAVHHRPKTYGGYDVSQLHAPRHTGYSSAIPNYRSALGYKLGGGVVHPLLDNKNLYKPRTFGDIYGNVNSQEPIYLGGSNAGFAPSKDAIVPVVPVKTDSPAVPAAYPSLNSQFNAYGYGAQPQGYAGRDVVGGYTGQKGTLYGSLPGYSNQQFSQY